LTGRGDDDGDGNADGTGERGSFADLVGDVKPLKAHPRQHPEAKPRPSSTRKSSESPRSGFRFPDPDEARLAAAHGVSDRVLRDLQRGDPPFDERLDLHGLDRGAARRHLEKNLRSAASRGLRCLLIVHGAGRSSPAGAVLRDALPEWLAKPPCARWLLAFAPAQRRDGGDGATYVLLRRSA